MFIGFACSASTCSVSLPTLASEFRYFSGKMVPSPRSLAMAQGGPGHVLALEVGRDPVLTNKSTVLFWPLGLAQG